MPTPDIRRVLVGWDGSAGASAGLRLGLRLTAAGGRLTALAVVPGFVHVEDAGDRKQAIKEVRDPLQAVYDSVVHAADFPSGGHASLEFVEAVDVAKTLDRYVATHAVELVIVGLHGREGLLHPNMGHIASQALRTARCPILVVPEPGRTAPYPADGPSTSRLSGLFHPFRHQHHEPI